MSGKILARTSALSLAVMLAACGGDESSTPIVNVNTDPNAPTNQEDNTGSSESEGEVGSGETTTPDDSPDTGEDNTTEKVALLGTGTGNNFTEGQLFTASPAIEAQGSHSFDLTLADPETKEPWLKSGQSVSYASPCIDAGIASIEGPTSADSGIIKASYKSSGCYGTDLVHAFVGDSTAPAASGSVTITPPATQELALADYNPQTDSITATGSIHSSSVNVSKYGQARLSVGVVDINDGNKLQEGIPYTVNFKAFCVGGENGSLLEPASVTTENGIAETIFTAGACNQSPQEIKATIEGADGSIAPASIAITVDESQAFQLVAALPDPMSIAPSFLSTEDRETVSKLQFTLKDQAGSGDGLPFEDVTFTIDSPSTAEFVDQGTGNAVNSITVTTDNEGVAIAQVRAKEGIDHEEFRVIATFGNLTTYSMPIVVNSMLPYEPKFSLSAENFAPNTWGINGVQSSLTIYVADKNGNRIRGNTYVNFQTDEGSIDPDCVVSDGRCTVTWESLRTSQPYATITASTHGRKAAGGTGTIESSTQILMSTNQNVFLTLNRLGAVDTAGTQYCATAWVQLPGEGATMFSPPVGTEISFEVSTGELAPGAAASKTIPSVGSLVLDSDGYEVCTTVKPEVDDTVTPNAYAIEVVATVQTPDNGDAATKITSDNWTD